jgi:mannose-6-phosphate isomerase-like protein (cupin superfamily)
MPNLMTDPVHLGLRATAIIQPSFSGSMDWYTAYSDRHDADGAEGRLVSMHSFSDNWDSWEMHPHGAEVVLCTAGSMTLYQELTDGRTVTHHIGPGEYVINLPGVWHTADVDAPATAVFITAGIGTEHRPRSG